MIKTIMMVIATLIMIGSPKASALGWANGITYYVSGYSYNGKWNVPIYSSVSRGCSQQYYNYLSAEKYNSIVSRGYYQYNSSGAYKAAIDNYGPICY